MSAGSRQARAFRTLRYTGLKLAEFSGGRTKKARPTGSSGNPTSGVYSKDNNTFGCQNPQPDFAPTDASPAPIPFLTLQNFSHRSPSLVDGLIGVRVGPRIGIRNRNFAEWLPS